MPPCELAWSGTYHHHSRGLTGQAPPRHLRTGRCVSPHNAWEVPAAPSRSGRLTRRRGTPFWGDAPSLAAAWGARGSLALAVVRSSRGGSPRAAWAQLGWAIEGWQAQPQPAPPATAFIAGSLACPLALSAQSCSCGLVGLAGGLNLRGCGAPPWVDGVVIGWPAGQPPSALQSAGGGRQAGLRQSGTGAPQLDDRMASMGQGLAHKTRMPADSCPSWPAEAR